MRVVRFMNSPAGRSARAVVGLALIAVGATAGGIGGLVVAIVGLVPLAAGASGVCLGAPLAHAPLRTR
ncbi:MAG: YgaP-like transmembrane domain [Streptosporangiaceae bacterium]